MSAVFLIVSRRSGKALTRTGDAGSPVQQFKQGNNDATQYWTLEPIPAGSTENFLIHPFNEPGLAITVKRDPGGDPTQPAPLDLEDSATGEVWHISRIANPAYFFLFEDGNNLLMDVPDGSSDDGNTIQVYYRNENDNQQWTFLPALDQVGA
jgi:hypothetical protein